MPVNGLIVRLGKRAAMLAFAGLLAGCVATTAPTMPDNSGVARSNTAIADEFIAFMFETENGTRIPRLLKYDTPVRVALDPALAGYRGDLVQVLGQMRRRAGVDIALTTGAAEITVEQVPAATLKRYYPTAACVVVPGVASFAEFRRGTFVRWSRQTRLTKASVFIPDNAPPYIVRACFNEEIAQALGPVNDLYRVANTVFNDDNVYNTLTGYDMLILKLLYSDTLQTGMGKAAVAARLPALLARLNPAGNRPGQPARADRRWQALIEVAMNPANVRPARLSAASQAVTRAKKLGDSRLIHSLLIYGRLNLRARPALAAPAFQEAYALSLTLLGPNNLRTALAAMHVAATTLESGRFAETLTLTTPALATAQRAKDPVMVAGIQGLRALAYARLGQPAKAERARLDSLRQARYAFGNNIAQINNAQAQLDGLLPANPPANP